MEMFQISFGTSLHKKKIEKSKPLTMTTKTTTPTTIAVKTSYVSTDYSHYYHTTPICYNEIFHYTNISVFTVNTSNRLATRYDGSLARASVRALCDYFL